ncbi:MAG: FAD:protein FMN transferase [Candidatus Fimimonas sp.]
MKKLCLAVALILVLCAFAPCVAWADSATQSHNPTYNASGNRFMLSSIVSGGNVVGVRFSGYYFGGSGIVVQAEVYSNENWDLDFYVGDNDFSEKPDPSKTYLTQAQTETKRKLIDLFETVDEMINTVDGCANTQYDGEFVNAVSDVYRYNAANVGEKLEIARETYEMLQIAKEMYAATDGAFNPAVYRLVDLWGFSSRIYSYGNFGLPYDRPVSAQEFFGNGYPLPNEKYVSAFSDSAFTNFSDDAVVLTQQDGKYFVQKNVAPAVVDGVEYNQWLDLGGIAKGYVVDEIKSLLALNNLDRHYVDAGSSSSVFGASVDGGGNTIVLTDPLAPDANVMPTALFGFNTGKCSVSTSGQYVRKYTKDGVEYSHIIDGTLGAPAQTGVKMVNVVVPESLGLWAAKSDCLTTALTVMGRDKTVEFINGYLKDNGITIVVAYQTFDGKKQILSNLDQQDVLHTGEHFNEYAWSLAKDENGNFVYTNKNNFDVKNPNTYKTLLIVLGAALVVCIVVVVVFRMAKGGNNLQKVQHARKDKPFKPADVGIYLAVVLLILVLFSAFFGGESESGFGNVQAIDMETGEQLFFYNVARKEYKLNEQSSNGWSGSVESTSKGLVVTLCKTVNGEERFNVFEITYGANPTVKMTSSVCGFHQDCVHSFGAITKAGGTIVCSPNRLKLVTE